MKYCSLNDFTDSLAPWLEKEYIRRVVIDSLGRVTFDFQDGVSDTYEITDCTRKQVEKICRDLAGKGIPVEGIS